MSLAKVLGRRELLHRAGIGAVGLGFGGVLAACSDGTIEGVDLEGVHDILAYDWQRFMDFADRHLR